MAGYLDKVKELERSKGDSYTALRSYSRNTWECAFCRRRSRSEKRIVLTIDKHRAGVERVRCCDLECLRRLLALWEELETKRAVTMAPDYRR